MSSEINYNVVEKESILGLTKRQKNILQFILILLLVIGHAVVCFSQNTVENTYTAKSDFVPVVKESIKFAEIPEIKDSVQRIKDIKYSIVSNPLFPKYQVQKIDAAKMKNEPINKLYHALIKAGYSPLYNMPYGEFFISNTRSRNMAYGAHLKHFSSSATLENTGYSGFSDNTGTVYGKKFYKKHTLLGSFDYARNTVHYYGFDATKITAERSFIKQVYQLIEPKIVLQSHFTDSSKINHIIRAGFYNLQGLPRNSETNVNAAADVSLFINKEKLNVGLYTDFYNHQLSNDTINNLIVSLAPSFEAGGKKWKAVMGLKATLDHLDDKTRFYFYPNLNVEYNIYENLIIPYAGASGGLQKNSLRSYSNENPFVDSTFKYTNTNNKYNFYVGLKGNLSSNTSYDLKGTYSQFDSMHFYAPNYMAQMQLYNRFGVLYSNASVINISSQIKYQLNEKIHFIGKGSYYIYQVKDFERAFHKPDFDLTFSGIYNLKSKIILRGDIFVIGQQWVRTQSINDLGVKTLVNKQIQGLVDANLEAEYRYSKMLSFFGRFNNIANQRYFRWENYPTQRFNFTLGLTFVPF